MFGAKACKLRFFFAFNNRLFIV